MNKRKLIIRFSATKKFEEVDYYFKTVIRRAILATLEQEKFPYDAEVSVTLCDNAYIRRLNKQYRNKDKHTDVLSFPIYDNGDFDMSECISGAMLGDIVISVERAKEQAAEIGNSFLREVAFLAIHSTLHLLGYDHERSQKDDNIQCEKQNQIISGIEI
ncbi:MAG: rRNA maturation RNase YbeY [Ruminococcaceae bacterium]|nr:rRNA maturation RNase YbeY [Oscillospiraceae bacterium]